MNGTKITKEAIEGLKDKLPGLTILWGLFEEKLSICNNPSKDLDDLERIFNNFISDDDLVHYDDWLSGKWPPFNPKTLYWEIDDEQRLELATALAGNPQCPSQVLKDLFNFPNDRDEMGWSEDNPLQLNVLSNPGCPLGVLYDVIKGDNDELKEAAAKSPAVKKLKPAGFGRYADPDTGEVIAKMQDGKLVPV